jgi:hypothetical protein
VLTFVHGEKQSPLRGQGYPLDILAMLECKCKGFITIISQCSLKGNRLEEVKVGNSVADGTEQSRAVSDKDDVSLFVHRPKEVGELNSAFQSFMTTIPGNPTSSGLWS